MSAGPRFTDKPAQPSPTALPSSESGVSAGFPSPAAEHSENRIDLQAHLTPHPSACFVLRAQGHSMTRAGIHDGDLLLVDRSLEPRHNDVIVAELDGEFVCKRLVIRAQRYLLAPDCDDLEIPERDVTDRDDFQIWGVVHASIRQHRPRS